MGKVFALYPTRSSAGQKLATLLTRYRNEAPVVLALTRSGVPVAFEIARALGAPLDMAGVKAVRVDNDLETPIGAVSVDGDKLKSRFVIESRGLTDPEVESYVEKVRLDLESRLAEQRSGRPALDLHGRTVILVDDGLHNDVSARLALRQLRSSGASKIILAAPVCSLERIHQFERGLVDDIVCSVMPIHFGSISQWYDEYPVVTDADVKDFLRSAADSNENLISA